MLVLMLAMFRLGAQEPSRENAETLELAAENTETEQENDEWLQQLQYLLLQPLNVNRLKEEQLKLLPLDPIQISSFLHYRELFGPFLGKYELQAIPYWDHATIRKLLPYLSFNKDAGEEKKLSAILAKGQHQLLLRTGNLLEKAKGFLPDSTGEARYKGNPTRLYFRYTYQFGQQFWMGITADKDAGETFGRKNNAFVDFFSFHLFVRRSGFIKSIALGDYVLNMGQGLIQWQGLSFGKTGEAISIYRQGNTLQPYRSGGEWNFHRGIALQARIKKLEVTIFGSSKKLSANLVTDSSAITGFSSISEGGYHRSVGELTDRKNLRQLAAGGLVQYIHTRFRAGASLVHYHFSLPFLPRDEPYNLHAIRGEGWTNAAVHYSYALKNIFLFGEAAWSPGGLAAINGTVISLHPVADLSLVYRNIPPGFNSLYSRTFSEQSAVNNEKGFYLGIRLRPAPGWQLQAYADYFRFPWLRFRADAPGSGQEYLLQIGWVKRRQWDIRLLLRWSEKPENLPGNVLNQTQSKRAANARLHVERTLNRQWLLSARLDRVGIKKALQVQKGWSIYLDSRYQLPNPAIGFSVRGHYFDTDGYDARVYAYERDLLYSFSIPSFYDRGWRYYAQLQGKLPRFRLIRPIKAQWWVRWAQTHYLNRNTIGSGWDEISGKQRSEWKCQLMFAW